MYDIYVHTQINFISTNSGNAFVQEVPSTELSTCLCTRKQILCLWRPSRSFCIDSWVFIMLDSICQARNNFKSSSWNSTPFELLTIFEYFPEFIFQVNNFFKDTPFKSTVDTRSSETFTLMMLDPGVKLNNGAPVGIEV